MLRRKERAENPSDAARREGCMRVSCMRLSTMSRTDGIRSRATAERWLIVIREEK